MPANAVPDATHECAARYQSLVAGQKVLVECL